MKKKYIKPAMITVTLQHQTQLMAESQPTPKNVQSTGLTEDVHYGNEEKKTENIWNNAW